MKVLKILRAGFGLAILSSAHAASGAVEIGQCDGYFIVEINPVPETYNGGFSTYVAAWPLLANYPGSRFQSGLPGTWMYPQYLGLTAPKNNYTDIEGGLGWWGDTRFATTTPKFIMGGAASEFSQVANGPGAGRGTWDKPAGKYGIAQLSNRILWPPDGLNLKQGTRGELFGYGYLPMPLVEAKSTTAGYKVPTGNNSWTLFLNTKSFKGPVAFYLPRFWSLASTTRSDLAGMGLDTRPSIANYGIQMETQYTPAVKGIANNGEIYARISPTYFPRNFGNQSVLMDGFTSYNKTALWDNVKAWFDGGSKAGGTIGTQGAQTHTFSGNAWCGWAFKFKDTTLYALHFDTIARPTAINPTALGYNWKIPLNAGSELVTMPEYYHLAQVKNRKMWVPASAKDIPTETGLAQYVFPLGKQNNSTPYTTPSEANSTWKTPGPKAGPFQALLGDSSVVTYYWYRFADQPALLNNELPVEEREKMQAYAEKIHTSWTKDGDYLPPPTTGIGLADLDPALIVTPPAGMESGYVPIVTKQEKFVPGTWSQVQKKAGPPFSIKPGQIVFSVSEAGTYTIAFHSPNGSIAAVMKDIACEKGANTVPFNRQSLATGVYIARITANSSEHALCQVVIRN